jgi:hypothetical protein
MTLMDQEGQVLRSGRVPNLRFEIERFLEGGKAMEAVIETERSSYTMVDVLEEMGVIVSHHHRRNLVFGSADRGLIFRLSDPIRTSLTVYHFQMQGGHDTLSLSGRERPKGRYR